MEVPYSHNIICSKFEITVDSVCVVSALFMCILQLEFIWHLNLFSLKLIFSNVNVARVLMCLENVSIAGPLRGNPLVTDLFLHKGPVMQNVYVTTDFNGVLSSFIIGKSLIGGTWPTGSSRKYAHLNVIQIHACNDYFTGTTAILQMISNISISGLK